MLFVLNFSFCSNSTACLHAPQVKLGGLFLSPKADFDGLDNLITLPAGLRDIGSTAFRWISSCPTDQLQPLYSVVPSISHHEADLAEFCLVLWLRVPTTPFLSRLF